MRLRALGPTQALHTLTLTLTLTLMCACDRDDGCRRRVEGLGVDGGTAHRHVDTVGIELGVYVNSVPIAISHRYRGSAPHY